ncbi:MAG: NAD(P)-dependent oxidoreductase [Hyphomicrobium sp.]
MAKVAWIGLGVMGAPMAGHLRKRGGHSVTVYNRTRAKAEAWAAAQGGEVSATPADAARETELVFSCVGNDDDLRAVTIGADGAFASMQPGAIFVDHTTTSAAVARELAGTAKARGLTFLDCPVSGGQAGAESGQLTIMAGGDAAAFAIAAPFLDCYARTATLIGESGAGQLTKMVNQIAVAGVVQGLSEAIHFAEQAGLDLGAVMQTITKGAAQSWQMENRWQTMRAREFNFGFAVDWMRKDLGFCIEEAARNGASLPVATMIDGFYADLQAVGGGRWDTSSLIVRLDELRKANSARKT